MSDEEASWMIEPAVNEATAWSEPSSDGEEEPAGVPHASSHVATENREAQSRPSQTSRSYSHLRELNKRLRSIYEENGLRYEGDTMNDAEICDRFSKAVSIQQKRINMIFNGIRLTKNVDLAFLVDATGSMDPYIEGVKEAILKIVKTITDKKVNGNDAVQRLRLAFVAYRDHEDALQFETLDFTNNVEEFRQFCGQVRAHGGDDGPEDVFGGLAETFKLSWDHAQAGTKIIFHICDYPCHGTEFHGRSMRDNFPSGDPKGRSHKELFKTIRERTIQYHFGRITEETNKMIEKFSVVYTEPIPQFDIKNVDQICDSVVTAVQESVWTSCRRSTNTTGDENAAKLKERDFEINTAEPNWDELTELNGTFLTYNFPRNIDDIVEDVPLKRNKPEVAKIKVAPQPFSRGVERIAFYGRDMSARPSGFGLLRATPSQKDIVLKEYAHEYAGNMAKRFETANQTQTIAAYLANRFCEELRRKAGRRMTIEFLKTKTLAVQTENGQVRYMACEKRYSADHKFIRFTNNVNYSLLETRAKQYGVPMEYVELLMSFSHWTHKVTDGLLMVVDLQGIVEKKAAGEPRIILTDPAIHCMDVTRYGSMNLGEKGMKNFLERHVCNEFCKKLGLDKKD